ncbi:MAG: DUF2283 domain-containing protein [Candidatus Korarchaeota archaeon]|nr:DUF2283 domain-containing protein [Candidatus Korarchaeota archaeon]
MKISYDREVDILAVHLAEGTIDYAEEAENMIIHFTNYHKPVLIEILDASDFLAELTRISIQTQSKKTVKAK